MKQKRATELEWLQWFYGVADFGPAHDDVIEGFKTDFMEETGKALPEGYEPAEYEEGEL